MDIVFVLPLPDLCICLWINPLNCVWIFNPRVSGVSASDSAQLKKI